MLLIEYCKKSIYYASYMYKKFFFFNYLLALTAGLHGF
jgi:hypothetical protein